MSSSPEAVRRTVRLPTSTVARNTVLALAATAAGVLGLVPRMPHPLSALLLIIFVSVGPGTALLAWLPPLPASRLLLVPVFGLTLVVIVTAVAAWFSWWEPHALFAMIALATTWSVIPNITTVVHDMVP